jgi:predicted metal-binding membrane protein
MNLTGATAERLREERSSASSVSTISNAASLRSAAAVHASGEGTVAAVTFTAFGAAAAVTLSFARSMSGGMPMPGGWTMSMMWMTMPGQTGLEAAALFVFMWLAMMVAMMLPSALPMLLVYRRVIFFRRERHPELHTFVACAGYFLAWTAAGLVAYVCGVAIARLTMAAEWASRLMPFASGVMLVLGGAWQFTPWKFACLKHCRDPLHLLAWHLDRQTHGTFGFGLHHGAYCAGCCWGLMLMMLALGVMNLAGMILVAVIIAAEKLLPRSELIARGAGGIAIIAGAYLASRALL